MVLAQPTDAREAAFLPLDRAGRAAAVVGRLSRAIDLGLISDGEQLPPETDLAAQLGVSTVTLREGLAVLRQQGLVETRRGRTGGSFVRARTRAVASRVRGRLAAMSTHELRDIGDLDVAIAGATARLAAERAGADQINRIDRLVEELASADGIGARHRADARFHIEVAAAAQSVRLTTLETELQAEVGDLLWLPLLDERDYHKAAVHEHGLIAAAIRSRDEDAAWGRADEHARGEVARLIDLHLHLTER
jgi:GntR family transcriptional regulator, transcriptional repressor for pyruvate dehydrogenase complex